MRIIFFGTPDFVLPVANVLLHLPKCQLVAVVTNPDRPVGRKQILTPSLVKQWALKHNIAVLTPNILDDNFKFEILNLKLDLGILAAYGKIIPKDLINLFPQGILVIHPSLLPKYRGASPIQTAILNGDKETGVSILQMDEKMDHGPILAQFKEKIKPDDTAETLTKRLFLKTASVILDLIGNPGLDPRFRGDDNKVDVFSPPKPQNHSLATFTKLLTKDNGFLNLALKGDPLQSYRSYNFIRAMTPWPGAWTFVIPSEVEGSSKTRAAFSLDSSTPPPLAGSVGMTVKRLRILKAHLEKEKLILDIVQLEGKKPVSWKEFQKGYPEATFF